MGSLEITHRQTEGLGHVDAGPQVMLDLQRNDLGIRGDGFGNGAPGCFHCRFEFQVVVDVAVEAGVDDGTVLQGGAGDGIVHRVAVGFGNRAHRGPACMGRHGVKAVGCGGDQLQDLILLNLLAQEANIVSQAADFGGNFIDCRQGHDRLPVVGGRSIQADAGVFQHVTIHAALEIRGEALLIQCGRNGFISLSRHDEQNRNSRRIPAPDFKPVDAVEHGVDLSQDGDAAVGPGGRRCRASATGCVRCCRPVPRPGTSACP